MTDLQQAAKLAIKVLEKKCDPDREVIAALKQAIAEDEKYRIARMVRELIPFSGITIYELDPDIVLDHIKGKLEDFVIAGYDKEGKEYFATTFGHAGNVLWILERMKMRIFMAEEDANND